MSLLLLWQTELEAEKTQHLLQHQQTARFLIITLYTVDIMSISSDSFRDDKRNATTTDSFPIQRVQVI